MDGAAETLVQTTATDGIALLTLVSPPVNALSRRLCDALIAALDAALADAAIGGIVIRAAGRTWPAGADIRELAQSPVTRTPALAARIAGAAKPVVALMHGTALGGGLEIALAATARLALAGTRLGLPEVTLGLVPGAGGTQRLPRIVGPGAALRMLLSGRPVTARRALEIGLIDGIVGDDAEEAAVALARSLAADGHAGASAGLDPPGDAAEWLRAVAGAREGLADRDLPAPARIADCVEAAALLPPDAALIFERTAFEDMWATPQSAALRHAFLAERRAARSHLLAGATARPLRSVLILGAGPGAAALAHRAVKAGLSVTVVAPDEGLLTATLTALAEAQEAERAAGRLSQAGLDAEWARVTGLADRSEGLVADGVAADLVLRADRAMPVPAGRPIAELSLPPVGRTGVALLLPDGRRLAEVVAGPKAAPGALATVAEFARRLGRLPVVSAAPLLATLLAALGRAADRTVEAGASPYAVDRALERWGMPSGIYRLRDAGGPAADPLPGSLMALVLAEIPGRRIHRDGGGVDADLLALIAAGREAAGTLPRRVPEAEIVERLLGAMANAGARLVEAEPGLTPAEVDVAMMLGADLPGWRGGPMHAADQAGLLRMRTALRGFAAEDAELWGPVPLWDRLIREGQRFGDLNG